MLELNEDLGETVALAHDFKSSSFWSYWRRCTYTSMKKFGGFNHNDQTLRVLTFIEKRHPNFDGLNLTWESLENNKT